VKISFLGIIILLLFPGDIFSAPCYGTKLPHKKELFAGIGIYALFNRNLKNDYGRVKSLQDFFLLTYGINDWLSLDLKIGTGYIKHHPDKRSSLYD